MATKTTVKKKNPRWVAVLEDLWANSDGPANKAEVMEMVFDNLLGFKVVKLTRQAQGAK